MSASTSQAPRNPAQHLLLEICVDTLAAAEIAARGGADRIELCAALSEGGLTPSLGLLERVLAQVTIPVHCMIRPRGGDFCYSSGDLRVMERDIVHARAAGAAGVVLGVLTAEGHVDVGTTRRLVAMARPMRVTFHRAFDVSADLDGALEDVIAAGADILLTSGGAPRLAEGAAVVARLVARAQGRIEIMGGSGVDVKNAAALREATGVAALHGSLRRSVPAADGSSSPVVEDASRGYELHEEDVRALATALHSR